MADHPKRIQLSRAKGWRMPAGAESEAARGKILDNIHELRGRDLACWCPPGLPCHADVLLEIANG